MMNIVIGIVGALIGMASAQLLAWTPLKGGMVDYVVHSDVSDR